MKTKYLSAEDRRNLRLLKHTSDVELIASVLESVFRREYTIQAVWEYREWFLMLPVEKYEKHPILIYGLVHIYINMGEFEKAYEIIDLLPEDNRYKIMCELMHPYTSIERVFELAEIMIQNGWTVDNLSLTGGRPFVLNGLWDMTAHINTFIQDDEKMKAIIHSLFKDDNEAIYDIMIAESMYWRDDCYGALIKVVSKIPHLKQRRDVRVLFAALTFEAFILVANGQADTAVPLIDNLRKQVVTNEIEEYTPNIDALEAWAAMYDGDVAKVTKWLRDDSPDEYGRFCLLDLFRYLIKMRAYIMFEKYMLVTSLANRLLPLCKAGHRFMDTCEISLLLAISDHSAGRTEEAFEHLKEALAIAEKYRYDRLIADEGAAVYELLKLYKKKHGSDNYLDRVIHLTSKMAEIHPEYLKGRPADIPKLTPTETKVLRLLAQEYTNAQIAEAGGTTVDTAKQHCKHICKKLGVKNRHQAVKRAIELGIIKPVKV